VFAWLNSRTFLSNFCQGKAENDSSFKQTSPYVCPMKNGLHGEPSPVLFFSLFRTDNPYSSISLSMARELAKTRRVLYVNHPYSLKDCIRGLLDGDPMLQSRLPTILRGRNYYATLDSIPDNFVFVQPPLTLPINWMPPGRIYDWFQRINNWIVLRSIQRAVSDYQFHNYLYINCYDPFFAGYLPEKMGARCCIYHCIDDISQHAYTARHGLKLEQEACRNADLTFVTSTNLKRLKEPFARRIVTYFNAADVSVFQKVWQEKYPRPKELEGRTGQVIGFIGNMDDLRIDYPLLKKIALAYPDKTLLLVGPINSPEPVEIGLDKLPNVVFAGSRVLNQLPPLLQYMDCVLIPFLCNTLTESIYPLKINEYLAAGKAVVSTSFSADIRSFAPVIHLAASHDDFIEKIALALAEHDPNLTQQRIEIANTNTWEARIQQLWVEVEKTIDC
jgi:teichuronic acid biosynthesis glycosyltransferase TuaH